jgi:hypothetical protein
MTDPQDPPRLLDSSAERAGLRDALRAAQANVGTDAQVARLASRLGPLLGVAVPASTGAATAVGAVSKVKLGLAGVALIVAGGGALLLSTSNDAPPPVPIPPSKTAEPPRLTVTEPAPAPVVPAPVVSETAPPTSISASKLPDKPQPPVKLGEADLLEQARSAIKSDPARALQRANEHAQRFPRGVLVQEREVLAIQALRKLGRDAEADRRAEAFAKAFPGSAFQRKLQR